MNTANLSISFFNGCEVRTIWDKQKAKWWFSVIDIVGILIQEDGCTKIKNYWKYFKAKLKKENNQWVSTINRLKIFTLF